MYNFFEEFFENLPDWAYWLSSIGAFIAMIAGIFKNLNNIVNFLKKILKFLKRKPNIRKFKNHIIFNKINDAINFGEIEMSSSTRSEIANILKDIKLKTYKKNIKDFLENGDLSKMSKQEIIEESKLLLFNSSKESNDLFKKEANNKEEEKTTLKILERFNYFENSQIKTAIGLIDDLLNELNNLNKEDIINNILTSYQFIVTDIISNTKETINRINGDLTGLYFKNKKIEKSNENI